MKKQTAVEWLAEIVCKMGYVSSNIVEQAKEMEKEQLADAFYVKLVEWRESIDEFGGLNLSNHIKYEKMTKDLSIFDDLASMIRSK